MPAKTDTSKIVRIPDQVILNGHSGDDEYEYDVEEIESLPTATIEDWLMDPTPTEEWVRLKTKALKVKLRGMTEEERQDIQRKAPKKVNKRTRQMEPDQDWINMELVRRALIEPAIPTNDLLRKSLSGDIAHLAKEIGRISGFDFERGDALG